MFTLLLTTFLFAAAEMEPRVQVLTADRAVTARAWSLGADGQLKISGAAAKDAVPEQTVDSPIMIDTDSVSRSSLRQGQVALYLVDGERFHGQILPADAPGTMRIETLSWDVQRIALDQIAEICVAGKRRAAVHAMPDGESYGIILTNGDVIRGPIKAITPADVTIASDFGDTDVDMRRIARIRPGGKNAALDRRKQGQSLCELSDNRRWYVDRMTSADRPTHIRLYRGTQSVEVPVETVHRIVFPDWTLQSLTAVKPVAVTTVPYLDKEVLLQIDDAGQRTVRALAGRSFVGGITTRPRSQVTYALETPAAFLVGYVGLDPVRGRSGRCQVFVEGKAGDTLYTQTLDSSSQIHRMAIPLKETRDLSLITDFGQRGEVGDVVNWCELILVRPLR